eukprot:TRINITY_DN5339_c0_g1_i1.p1 TRINITY_DN5339_c0_g1~~TRINITY_DN5339_c0_g1_i1.p1  ORF type:complete len:103 (-),score=19.12 TRINITY_DN5339_c0_g1_i1:139-447(-)
MHMLRSYTAAHESCFSFNDCMHRRRNHCRRHGTECLCCLDTMQQYTCLRTALLVAAATAAAAAAAAAYVCVAAVVLIPALHTLRNALHLQKTTLAAPRSMTA